MRRFVLIMLALVAVLALPTSASAAPAGDARAFVDSIGVNTHLYYTDTVYNNYPLVKDRLQWLGVRHVRDSMDPSERQFFYDRVNDLGNSGIKSTLINCRFTDKYNWKHLTEAMKINLRGSVEAAEGVNEPDLQQGGQHDDGSWWNDAKGCNYWTKTILARDGWEGPPLVIPTYGPSVTGDRAFRLGDMRPPYSDGGNIHPYPGSDKPSGPGYWPVANQVKYSRDQNYGGQSYPVVATETGYHDAVNHTGGHKPVSERADAIYMPRLFLDYDKAGVKRTFTYELFDLFADSTKTNEQRAFGLFRNDGTAKPSATAVKNTIGFLDSAGKSAQTSLAYTLGSTEDEDGTGTAGPVKDSLFQKADGSWWLALWQDSKVYLDGSGDVTNPTNIVDVTLPRTMNVIGYRPTQSTGSVGSLRGSAFRAGVSDDVLLIKLTD